MEVATRTIYALGSEAAPGQEPVFRHQMARMFRSGFLEAFSKVHPIVPALIYVPVVAYTGALGFGGTSPALAVLGLLGGLLFWTLLEYSLHRFLFHLPRRGPVSTWLYLTFHGVHHMYPDDRLRLVMVPTISLPLAVFFWIAFSSLLPPGVWQAAYAGLVAGYLGYDYSHWATHFLKLPKAGVLAPVAAIVRGQRRRHMRHHFADHDRGYGVSVGLWDHVFGTADPALRR